MENKLSNSQQATYDAILRHPAAHNLHWRDVRSLLGELAEVVEEAGGNVKVTRNGRTLVLHPDGNKNVETWDELKELRKFLEGSDETLQTKTASGEETERKPMGNQEEKSAGNATGKAAGARHSGEPGSDVQNRVLVVMDHREARIYRSLARGTTPEVVQSNDPDRGARYLHNVDNESNGQRRPDLKSYYDAIAKSLRGVESVLVFSGGKGTSNAGEQLILQLASHNKELVPKVIGVVSVDEHHMTEDQILAKARDVYDKGISTEKSET